MKRSGCYAQRYASRQDLRIPRDGKQCTSGTAGQSLTLWFEARVVKKTWKDFSRAADNPSVYPLKESTGSTRGKHRSFQQKHCYPLFTSRELPATQIWALLLPKLLLLLQGLWARASSEAATAQRRALDSLAPRSEGNAVFTSRALDPIISGPFLYCCHRDASEAQPPSPGKSPPSKAAHRTGASP